MWKCKEWWNIQLTLRICCGPLSQHPLPSPRHKPATFVDSICQAINQEEKAKNPEMRFSSQQNESFHLGLCMQNPGLKEVDLEPSSKRGSDKINVLKQGGTTPEKNKSYRTAWTHICIQAFREVDLEPRLREEPTEIEALVSLYWSSWSLHLKKPPNWILHKSTKVDPIRSSRTWKKSEQISKSYALQHMKTNFLKNKGSTNAYDWGYQWGRHTQR